MGRPAFPVAGVDLKKYTEELPRLMGPIPPILADNINLFLLGFRRLALVAQISPYMAHYLRRLFKWFNDLFKAENPVAAPTYNIDNSSDSSMIEKVLAIGLVAFLDYLQGVERHNADESIGAVLSQTLGSSIVECDKDTLTWSRLMLAATLPENVDPWPWVNQALAEFQIKIHPEKRIELSRTFLSVPRTPRTCALGSL